MKTFSESVVRFKACKTNLFGIFHQPRAPRQTAVIIVVGGPQYRVGSHRMFVRIARDLAAKGVPVLRFDVRGMGDSDGMFPGFEDLDTDIKAAVDCTLETCPLVKSVVLLGLCDGATAASFYAQEDQRISGLILLNPWVHTQLGEANTHIWYYYPQRIIQVQFWRRLLRGEVAIMSSMTELVAKIRRYTARVKSNRSSDHFVTRMRKALTAFHGPVFVALSANDMTALEFHSLLEHDAAWQALAGKFRLFKLEEADHTLSSQVSMTRFLLEVEAWLSSLELHSKPCTSE